jgi:hypothetical protein
MTTGDPDADEEPITQRDPVPIAALRDSPAPGPLGPRLDYEVTISYQEPTFAARSGLPLLTYRGVFRVRALDEHSARAHAIDEFRRLEMESSVNWVRVIVEVECRAVPA